MAAELKASRGEISLSDAAGQLGISWFRAWTMVLKQELKGRQLPNGRYAVREDSVAKAKAILAQRGAEPDRAA